MQALVGREHFIHDETRPKQHEGQHDQHARLPILATRHEPALRRRRKYQTRHRGTEQGQYQVERTFNINQQQLGVEDEHEGQHRGPDRIGECRDTRLDRIGQRDTRRRIGRQPHRWGHVGHQTKIEHEQVHRDQGNQQPVLRADLDDHRRHQGRHDDVVGSRWQAHAQNQADEGDHEQHDDDVAARERLHQFGHHQADAGQRHRTDDHARCGGRDTDADHVACAGDQAVEQILEASTHLDAGAAHTTEECGDRALRDQDKAQEHRRPEGRQRGRELLDHQVPDQRSHRQQIVQAGFERRPHIGKTLDRVVRVIHVQFRILRRQFEQRDVSDGHQHRDDDN